MLLEIIEEVTIPIKKCQGKRYNLNTVSFFIDRFWSRRLDGIAGNQ